MLGRLVVVWCLEDKQVVEETPTVIDHRKTDWIHLLFLVPPGEV